MEYCIVKGEGATLSSALSELTNEVNQKLKEGWGPQGGVTVVLTDTVYDWFYACQAMIKNYNNSNKNNNCC